MFSVYSPFSNIDYDDVGIESKVFLKATGSNSFDQIDEEVITTMRDFDF